MRALDRAVLAKGREMLFSGTPVATSKEGLYTYPDLVTVRGRPEFWQVDPNALSDPKVIIEILSPSSGDYDRGAKFELYRTIPSLSEYPTVHQDAPFVEHHGKLPDGSWVKSIRQNLADLKCNWALGEHLDVRHPVYTEVPGSQNGNRIIQGKA